MAMKGLRVAHETLGPESDPNAPRNRPKFLDPLEAMAQAAAEAEAEAAAAAAMGMVEGGAEFDGQMGKLAGGRRAPKQPRETDGRSDGVWGAGGEGELLTPTSTGLKVRFVCVCVLCVSFNTLSRRYLFFCRLSEAVKKRLRAFALRHSCRDRVGFCSRCVLSCFGQNRPVFEPYLGFGAFLLLFCCRLQGIVASRRIKGIVVSTKFCCFGPHSSP